MAKLWFRARRYGWGWQPASIEGGLVMLAFVVAIGVITILFVMRAQAGGDMVWATILFLFGIVVLVAALVAIAWCKGEQPSWRWGND